MFLKTQKELLKRYVGDRRHKGGEEERGEQSRAEQRMNQPVFEHIIY